ncbi:hypothetical protein Y032_0008g370 [Ancylostoma ceylanicum]|uniref:Uncharacterized protein n=1 Tax=Ancylostoma ceylanicum TaxID=53326 RepID=A0A016VMC5_9BILA|nr:hypothetical protein Y032_0008g370 [Ancylostoma ceylanicum]
MECKYWTSVADRELFSSDARLKVTSTPSADAQTGDSCCRIKERVVTDRSHAATNTPHNSLRHLLKRHM